jgi:hypothetical protein
MPIGGSPGIYWVSRSSKIWGHQISDWSKMFYVMETAYMCKAKKPQNPLLFCRPLLAMRANISLEVNDAVLSAIGDFHDLHPCFIADGNRQ